MFTNSTFCLCLFILRVTMRCLSHCLIKRILLYFTYQVHLFLWWYVYDGNFSRCSSFLNRMFRHTTFNLQFWHDADARSVRGSKLLVCFYCCGSLLQIKMYTGSIRLHQETHWEENLKKKYWRQDTWLEEDASFCSPCSCVSLNV